MWDSRAKADDLARHLSDLLKGKKGPLTKSVMEVVRNRFERSLQESYDAGREAALDEWIRTTKLKED